MTKQNLQVVTHPGRKPESAFDPITAQIMILVETFGNNKPMSTALQTIWRSALSRYSIDEVIRAVEIAVTTKKPYGMIKLPELIEIIEGSPDDKIARAWDGVMEALRIGGLASVYFYDPATARSVDAVWGSWSSALELTAAGWVGPGGIDGGCSPEMLAHYMKSFAVQYRAAMNSGAKPEPYRLGPSEASFRGGAQLRTPGSPQIIRMPVILIGERTKEIRLPFDVEAGRLTAESRIALAQGQDVAEKYASEAGNVLLPARPPVAALPPGKDEIPGPLAQIVDGAEKLTRAEQARKFGELRAEFEKRRPAVKSDLKIPSLPMDEMDERAFLEFKAQNARQALQFDKDQHRSMPDQVDPDAKTGGDV